MHDDNDVGIVYNVRNFICFVPKNMHLHPKTDKSHKNKGNKSMH